MIHHLNHHIPPKIYKKANLKKTKNKILHIQATDKIVNIEIVKIIRVHIQEIGHFQIKKNKKRIKRKSIKNLKIIMKIIVKV